MPTSVRNMLQHCNRVVAVQHVSFFLTNDKRHALRCNNFKALPFASDLIDRLRALVVNDDGSVNCNLCPV